jgi:hypothetical protein
MSSFIVDDLKVENITLEKKSEWLDITQLCHSALLEMTDVEPMICIEDYSKWDAMNAVELMDPKMDQCFGITGSMEMNILMNPNIPEPLNVSIILKLFQSLFVYEAAFLDGASLLESTHQCVYLWEESWEYLESSSGICEKTILYFCKSLNKSLGHIVGGVLSSDIYEEEDFQPMTSDKLSNNLNDEDIIIDLNNLIELIKENSMKCSEIELNQLLSLLQFRRDIHSLYITLNENIDYAVSNGTKSKNQGIPIDASILKSNTLKTQLVAKTILGSIENMKLVFELSNNNIFSNDIKSHSEVPEIAFAFNETVVKIKQSSPVRHINFLSFSKSILHIQDICNEILHICNISIDFDYSINPEDIDKGKIDYSTLLHTSINISREHLISRSLFFSILSTFSGSMSELIQKDMLNKGLPSLLVGSELVQERWLSNLSKVAWDTLKILTAHRNKVLIRLDANLSAWGNIGNDARYVDIQFREENGILDEKNQWSTYWSLIITTLLMDLHMSLLVEMELLNIVELSCFFWYWDYICSTRVWVSQTLQSLKYDKDCALYEFDVTNLKNNKKINKKVPVAPVAPITSAEELLLKGKGHLCRGLFRLLYSGTELGLIESVENKYTTPSFRFSQRFRAFQTIHNPPMLKVNINILNYNLYYILIIYSY